MIAPGSSTAYVALGALTPSIASFSCRQEDKLSNDGLFIFLRRTEAELGHLGASPFSLGASPCKACSPPFMVDFIVFSSLFRVVFVLPVGLARLDVMSFLSPFVDWSALAIPLNRLRVISRFAGHQDGAWAQHSGQCYFFFRFLESSSTCCLVFRCGGSFLSFLMDEFFSHPPNRKIWLLEPKIGGVFLLGSGWCDFFVFLNEQRLVRCACFRLGQ